MTKIVSDFRLFSCLVASACGIMLATATLCGPRKPSPPTLDVDGLVSLRLDCCPFAGAAVTLQHLNTQLALGQPIDLSQHAQAVSAMVRGASRLTRLSGWQPVGN
jgi:hypothetical protein